jgi:apolipoprotein N-acyltransferase
MAACVVVFAVYGYGVYRLNNVFTGERVRVSVAQANIPQKDKWDPDFAGFIMDKYAALTKECAEKKPDLVIWPETSVPGFLEADKDLSDRVSSLAKDAGANLLVGAPRHEAGNGRASYYNSSYLYLKDGSSAGRYDKVHLVPFGEYLPFERLLSFVERFSRRPIGDFTAGADYTVFGFFVSRASAVKNVRMRTMKRVPFSCLICFEDIFPELARRFVAGGALFLANMTNDAWFGRSGAPYEHAQASVFRAIENRVNVVRAANTGVSCFIDQKGDITARAGSPGADIFVEGTVTREIVLSKTRTLYNTYGDVFAYICAALALCGIVLRPKAA